MNIDWNKPIVSAAKVEALHKRIAELEAERDSATVALRAVIAAHKADIAELERLRAERREPDTFDKVSAWIHESTEEASND